MMSLSHDPSGGEESVRKRAWVLLLAMVAFLLAGGVEALGLPDASQPPPKDYAYRNGKVIVGGDQVTDCRTFASMVYPRDATSGSQAQAERAFGGSQAQAERALEQCEQAGHVALPGTGGGSAPLLAAGLLLVCAGLGLVAIHRSA
jgi:hypothetical protein